MRARVFRPELVFFATLCLVAAAAAAWLFEQLRFTLGAQRSWSSAPATVLEARSESLRVPRPYGRVMERQLPELFYAYEVDGREFEGRAIAPLWLPLLASDRYQLAALRGLEPQQPTWIRFDPQRPEQSYLTLDCDLWLVLGLLAVAAGIALQAGGAMVRALLRRDSTDGETPASGERGWPVGALLAGVGSAAVAARYLAWGEWAIEAWVAALLLLAWSWIALRTRPAVASA